MDCSLLGESVHCLSAQLRDQIGNLLPNVLILRFKCRIACDYVSSDSSFSLGNAKGDLLQQFQHDIGMGHPLAIVNQTDDCSLGDDFNSAEKGKYDQEADQDSSFDREFPRW